MVQVVPFAGTLTNTGKYRVTTVEFGNVIYKFLNKHGFAHTSTTEEIDFIIFSDWGNQVDDFDARF
jgi:hypothetical protein